MAKIYISSTYNDLIEYRDTVYKSLRKMGHDVIAMEDYVASDDRPVDKCLSDVQRCDIYIGIFAWRYGFIPNSGSNSITEQEYKHAKKHNIPCLIFLLDEKTPWSPNFIDSHTGDGDKGKLISSLRNNLKNESILSFFDEKTDLAVKAAIAVYRHEREKGFEKKPPLWEYLLTIDLLKLGLGNIDKQYSDLKRGIIYRPYKTINNLEILEWIRQKLDDLIALTTLLSISATEELMNAWGEPGQAGDEEEIRDATTKILDGCRGLLEWEIDLAFARLPNGFENIKKMMQGWTYEYIVVSMQLHKQIENIISIPDAEGKFKISVVFEAPKNIEKIIPEVQKFLSK
jgi:hypothetical protein